MIETKTIKMHRANLISHSANSLLCKLTKSVVLIFTCILFFSETALAEVSLNDISYSALPGDKVQLSLEFSEALQEEPVNFTIDNPARIAIDLPNVTLNLEEKSQSIGIGMAHSVAAVEAAGRTRVVVNLVSSTSYDIRLQGNLVLVTLGAGKPAMDDMQSVSSTSISGRASIENIDFRRGDEGEGRIIVKLSDSSVNVNMGLESGQIVVDFISTNLPSELDRRLDVIDFATPVKEVDTSAHAGGVRMLISTVNEQYDHMAYQSEDVFTIEVRPLSREEQEEVK